ncbi:hypothetical protein G9A89_017839 [Geosiphon pyriformis]|nr:hypothetical protein G9A89_017839 [Geosiphon pyriformis]
MVLCKDFVFNGWLQKTVSIFHNSKIASMKVVEFVHSLCLAFRNDIWLVCVKHQAYIKKKGLIPLDGSAVVLVSGLASGFLAGVIKLLGVAKIFGISFGYRKHCSFFLDIGASVSVYIPV